jgi:SMI1-KNR4 cell-wall
MLDYRLWAERALEFTRGLRSLSGEIKVTADLHPPLSAPAVRDLNSRLRLPLPEPLCAFLTRASSNCSCTYWWEPPGELQGRLQELFPSNTFIFGGASLCDSSRFETNERGCFDTAEALEKRLPEEARLWANSVPFHECGNGDFVGLYVGNDRQGDAFPVVYLDHDGCGASEVLAPNFEEFLIAWEELNYIHGFFLREYFFNPIRGSINPNSPKKADLDDLFRSGGKAEIQR